ncbi:MAG: hypothetical protein BMS9Abin19_0601 [Gammaproteobacteria bacterium]|nr:MAG: hypothetical protein BMS9Abin19_0601 [Gammaproteobacteria bacterium]
MNKFNVCVVLLITMLSVNVCADEKHFLTVDELVDNGYILLSGEQVLEIMGNHTIKVVDIETDAVTISRNDKSGAVMDRKFVETKNDKASSLLDARLLARAPALEGKIEREVVGDELIATDGVRTYHYKLYKKQEKIYAVRDIDHGNVFFEVEVK